MAQAAEATVMKVAGEQLLPCRCEVKLALARQTSSCEVRFPASSRLIRVPWWSKLPQIPFPDVFPVLS
jgi:hypothetical protein